jgi:hypothetical protein
MAINSKAPGFYEVNYHSAYAPHKMEICTRLIDVPSLEFESWDTLSTPAVDTMVTDLVTLFLPFFPSTVEFDNWKYFYQPTKDDLPLLVSSGAFTSLVGTDGSPGWTKANQGTLSYMGTGGSKGRLVFLDSTTDNDFSPILTAPPMSDARAIMDELSNTGNAWSTRGNERPETFLGYFKTINEKLRREYHMQ